MTKNQAPKKPNAGRRQSATSTVNTSTAIPSA